MSGDLMPTETAAAMPPDNRHRLELIEVELVGGHPPILFRPGFNLIHGDQTTGKTTLVKLIRAMLGSMPKKLPPEVVEHVTAIRGRVYLGPAIWNVYRPRTTTADALVEVSEEEPAANREPVSLRLPVKGRTRSYSLFLLDQLGIPAIDVPKGSKTANGAADPVTMTDWLTYCIITGNEIDTELMGSGDNWQNNKRQWVFQLAYGLYDPAEAHQRARLRSLELQIAGFDQAAEVREKFLAETPFADRNVLQEHIAARRHELERVIAERSAIAQEVVAIPGVEEIRRTLLAARTRRADLADRVTRIRAQLQDLHDLHKQLSSQSARFTRAIVADEWLVDFDFLVCPRCGNDVVPARTEPDKCYLCLQHPRPAPSRADMLAEQDRIANQITETADVINNRSNALSTLESEVRNLDVTISEIARQLDRHTTAFVSDRANALEHSAAQQARLESEIRNFRTYAELLERHERDLENREELQEQLDAVKAQLKSRKLDLGEGEENIKALERRLLEYLRKLRPGGLGGQLTVSINRTTYEPIVSGRAFEELSSQGLTTLVNIAHALAHHTVAIDRNLPMPGLLILDGVSANAGHEGFDLDRVSDVYRLLSDVGKRYRGRLQIVAVDNEVDRSIILQYAKFSVLTLTQEKKLIRPDQSSNR
ncbi:hypothetical protein GCM10027290_52610 [Micromonospora sonneratiae]|uniref:AAA domain-containing protein n=1 Tax=Micromonospora sonneratiae TaxID=1184706 RepID=A0ABW3YNM9_9ACTN